MNVGHRFFYRSGYHSLFYQRAGTVCQRLVLRARRARVTEPLRGSDVDESIGSSYDNYN